MQMLVLASVSEWLPTTVRNLRLLTVLLFVVIVSATLLNILLSVSSVIYDVDNIY